MAQFLQERRDPVAQGVGAAALGLRFCPAGVGPPQAVPGTADALLDGFFGGEAVAFRVEEGAGLCAVGEAQEEVSAEAEALQLDVAQRGMIHERPPPFRAATG
ncbi:PhrC/PhrF family phosphatase-inhibitory pheromone [Deinococcus sp. YIM 77859]|uniref:PhrC/PhrF family phosphatase-inhibitory pheromone n=1 Tax=Deinococcus sp. YIM 77859 TaxID=1540221 RepID=UPI00350E541B